MILDVTRDTTPDDDNILLDASSNFAVITDLVMRLILCQQNQARIKVGVGPRHCTTVGPSVSHLSPSTHC